MPKRRLAPVEDEPSRETDDSEIDRVGDLIDRFVSVDAGDRLPLTVDGIDSTTESALHDVAEEVASDRAGPR